MTIVNEALSSTPIALIYVGESICERGNPRMSDMTIVFKTRLLHSNQNLHTIYADFTLFMPERYGLHN
jgi:hypothetical protein